MSTKSSLHMKEELREAAWTRLKALGYESFSGYIAGLVRADIITGPPHDLPQRIGRMSGHQRDKIDAALISQAGALVAEIGDDEEEDIIAVAKAYRERRRQVTPAQSSKPNAA